MADGRAGYPDDFFGQVALGIVPGCQLLRKFGDNEALPGTGVTTDIWPATVAGVARRVLPSSAGVATIVSTDADDDGSPAGNGANTVMVEGLDANYLEISEEVTMNGITGVTTTKSFLRINRMYNTLCGSSAYNEGDITGSIGGNVQAVIEANEGQTNQAMYTVPGDQYLLITDFEITTGRMTASGDLHVFGEVMVEGTNAWRIVENIYLTGGQNFDTHRPVVLFPPKAETRVSGQSTSEVQLSAMYGGLLIKAEMLANM
jgi:hypothetical protein